MCTLYCIVFDSQQIELDREENSDTDRFLEECVADPTLRDKLSILSRTFQNRKRVWIIFVFISGNKSCEKLL